MTTLIITASIIGTVVLLQIAVTLINILQKGGPYKGKKIEEILGKEPGRATVEDLGKMTKPRLMQLYYSAPAPSLSSLKGEYGAKTIPVGIQAFSADYFTHHFFGPGRWEGKAFLPLDKDKGHGYNIFKKGDTLFRTRRMNTYIGPSKIDGKPSFHLDYSPYNKGVVHSMHDELRIINDGLFLGMGYMGIGGGSINPAPFIVHGDVKQWVGADDDKKE